MDDLLKKYMIRANVKYEVKLPIKQPKAGKVADIGEIPMDSEDSCNIKDIGDEVNVRLLNLSVDFKGTTPTTAQNDVNVTVVLEVPRISALSKTYKAKFTDTDDVSQEYEWKIIDFITYHGNTDSATEKDIGYIQNVKYSALNSRIIAKIGYETELLPAGPLKDVLETSPLILITYSLPHFFANSKVFFPENSSSKIS